MVTKRQKLARKRFKEANPGLFPKPQGSLPSDTNAKKSKHKPKKKKFKPSTDAKKPSTLRKHPLRVPGLLPGDGCFICKAKDHIAKQCPSKEQWEKNKICLLCRQHGHSLRNCPNKNDSNDKKYCYNCGETGHALSKCPRPIIDGGTKFANCFICKESGHLSKTCPKNTHGIYPKGGSCKICGSVRHLARHCPSKGKETPTAASEAEYKDISEENGERQQCATLFSSGDDLVDDFMLDDVKVNDKTTPFHPKAGPMVAVRAEKVDAKSKKKDCPRVVNFLG